MRTCNSEIDKDGNERYGRKGGIDSDTCLSESELY